MIGAAAAWIEAHYRGLVATLIAATVGVRLLAWFAIGEPLGNDGLAYFRMAEAMAGGHWPVDQWGQHAFYSIGYPAVLTPFFALFGASVGTAIAANLALAAASAVLLVLLAREIAMRPPFVLLLLLVHALWIPGIWNSAMLARENLSTPLFLLVLLASWRLLRGGGSTAALLAGVAYGAAILTGGSALPLIVAPLLALLWTGEQRVRRGLLVGGGALALLIPWAAATTAMVGAPTLNTNGGFNLYLGNNPAATGAFVSIADTSAGPEWEEMRQRLGERGASAELGARAIAYAGAHPARTASLGLTKLALFWAPNVPDAADFAQSRAVATARFVEVAQYLLILGFALFGLLAGGGTPRQRWIVAAAIAGFWALHAAAYVITRYRDPAIPALMLFAVVGWSIAWDRLRPRPKEALDAAA
jgi:hypothetical protein